MPITHAFVPTQADGADPTLFKPSHWKADHVILDDDGWVPAGETWTYASASTFTVPTDLTAKYTKGTKIKLTQTTAKYFYVKSSTYGAPNTTVTVYAGTDFTLANPAITLPFYSYAVNPQGHPITFNYTPTITAAVGAFTTASGVGTFSMIGNIVLNNVEVTITLVGTGSVAVKFTVPIDFAVAQFWGVGGEVLATGKLCNIAQYGAGLSNAGITYYDNSDPCASVRKFVCSGRYFC